MELILRTGELNQNFNLTKFPCTIGSSSDKVDISIAGLEPTHLRITKKENLFYIVNETNDPFLALNGSPFFKKKINHGDVLELPPDRTIEFNLEKQTALVQDSKISVEKEPPKPSPPVVKNKPIPIICEEKELEEPPPKTTAIQLGKISGLDPIGFGKKIRYSCMILGAVLIMVAFTASAIYTKAAENALNSEMIAAENIADIAMAFKHAQVHNLRPKKHNWSDPEFIKNNLAAVTSPDCPSINNIDAQGHFQSCPYLLRAYTNNDFSHFIIIAQPNPSITHWFAQKKTIVVDSKLMELRKINDIRSLNRLLINAGILDGEDAGEVTNVVRSGDLIPLSTLASVRKEQSFMPPKGLGLMHPGAQNKIYNAPRYHHFGESIVKRALQLGANVDNPGELSRLRHEMQILSKFPDTVLYSSQGMEVAMQTRRALRTILPDAKFLIGFLRYNEDGSPVCCSLIVDQNPSEIVAYEPLPSDHNHEDWLNVQKILQEAAKKLTEKPAQTKVNEIQERITLLKQERAEALLSLQADIAAVIEESLPGNSPAKIARLENSTAALKEALKKSDAKFREEILSIYQENISIPFSLFFAYIQDLHLEGWIPHSLKEENIVKKDSL